MKYSWMCLLSVLFLVGCSSSYKARQELREKSAATSGLFCEFVSGDEYTDVDVEVSLRMGKKCDSRLPFSITSYKNASENHGVVYCCNTVRSGQGGLAPTTAPLTNSTSAVKAESGKSVSLPSAPAPKEKAPEITE